MLKFSDKVNEAKKFSPDPSIIKKYASFIIPLYITGELKCQPNLLTEYLEMNKPVSYEKNRNIICDLEVEAIKQVLDNPMTKNGYEQLEYELVNKCIKLERFLRTYLRDKKIFE